MTEDRPSRPEEVFSKRARFYTTSKVHADKETLSWLVDLAEPGKDTIALDVGTGAGHAAMALAPLVKDICALDVTKQMIDEARTLSEQRNLANFHLILGDALTLPFRDGCFDVVVSRRAVHHFPDVRRSLREMVRVLRSSGRLIVDDRSVPEDAEVDAVINRIDSLHDASHIRDYRLSEWIDMLTEIGMKIESAKMYTREMKLSHFTDMVDEGTAKIMDETARGISSRAKTVVRFAELREGITLDNFYVLISATKN